MAYDALLSPLKARDHQCASEREEDRIKMGLEYIWLRGVGKEITQTKEQKLQKKPSRPYASFVRGETNHCLLAFSVGIVLIYITKIGFFRHCKLRAHP
jgi:hypothetical protein